MDYLDIPGVYAAGRLDADSEGLLILTDDGRLQKRIADPAHKLSKAYWVQVEGEPDEAALVQLRKGVDLGDFITRPAAVRMMDEPATLAALKVRRGIFERLVGNYLYLKAGCQIVIAESLDALPSNLLEIRPTLMSCVPRFYEKLYARVLEAVASGSPLRRRIFHWALAVGGERLPYALEDKTALDGILPINPTGGLKSRGHPVGASGLAQVVEAVKVLKGESALDRSFKRGLTQSTGGLATNNFVTILERADAPAHHEAEQEQQRPGGRADSPWHPRHSRRGRRIRQSPRAVPWPRRLR